ncbi:MAG: alpha/beta fold hydrolase [Bacteroidia bacterium]|nr:alpha/beta fold hydrolase [Bacteroidia bacterium]
MKLQKLIIILLITIISTFIYSQNNNEIWLGKLNNNGINLRLIIVINNIETDSIKAHMESPDQGANNIKVDEIKFSDDSVFLKLKKLSASYKGKRKDNNLTGIWKQGSYVTDLSFYKVDSIPVIRRPQEPKAPFTYEEREITFENKKADIKLSGTLTQPKGKGPFPAVILISGSGPQNRNEEILGHKPFLVIADYLTKNGIAVFRYDDRGIGKSGGVFSTATTLDFATDAEAAFNTLQNVAEIDKNKIGLMGHSEGGMIAPIVAAKNKKISFIVLLAGPGIKITELMKLQIKMVSATDTTQTTAEINENVELSEKIYQVINENADNIIAKEKIKELYKPLFNGKDSLLLKQKGITESSVQAQTFTLLSPWFRYFIAFNPDDYLSKVKCPVLAINGTKDTQVSAIENLEGIKSSLTKSNNKNFTIKLIENKNHLFQTATTGAPSEYNEIEETFAPDVLEIINDWLQKNVVTP